MFYLLAKHPKEIDRLREELAPYVDVSNEVMSENISHLDHLNGVINEALRLYPPVPSAIYRKTPTQGITIDGIYIPGDMTVYCLQYTLGRSKSMPSFKATIFNLWNQVQMFTQSRTALSRNDGIGILR